MTVLSRQRFKIIVICKFKIVSCQAKFISRDKNHDPRLVWENLLFGVKLFKFRISKLNVVLIFAFFGFVEMLEEKPQK
jgi:hypothetical protein